MPKRGFRFRSLIYWLGDGYPPVAGIVRRVPRLGMHWYRVLKEGTRCTEGPKFRAFCRRERALGNPVFRDWTDKKHEAAQRERGRIDQERRDST